MALQGTLDTFALADVLRLLASTSKTGRLQIDGRRPGSVHLRDGSVVGGEVDAEFDDSVGVVFQLLRSEQGSFEFLPDDDVDGSHDPMSVDEVVSGAEARLADWLGVEAVVPSLGRMVTPSAELPFDEMVIDRARWSTLIATGEGRTVAEIGERLGMGELDVSRAVKTLVDDGLVGIGDEDVDGPDPDVVWDGTIEPPPLVDDGFEPDTDDHAVSPTDESGDDTLHGFEDLMAEFAGSGVDDAVRAELGVDDGSVPEGGSRDVDIDAALDAVAEGHDYLDGEGDDALPEPLPEVVADETGQGGEDPGTELDGEPVAGTEEPSGAEAPDDMVGDDPGAPAAHPFLHDPDPDHLEKLVDDDPQEVARQLAQLSPKAAEAIAAAAGTVGDHKPAKAKGAKAARAEDPMNRSLLQKFISSK